MSVIGCVANSHEESSGLDPRCTAPCEAREARGCAGVVNYCKAICTAVYAAAGAQGACKTEAEAVEDCFNSDAVLDLGCSPDFKEKEAICRAQLDELDACQAARDG